MWSSQLLLWRPVIVDRTVCVWRCDDADGEVGHRFGAYQSERAGDSDSNLWPLMSLLIVVVVVAAVALLLVVHHYRYQFHSDSFTACTCVVLMSLH